MAQLKNKIYKIVNGQVQLLPLLPGENIQNLSPQGGPTTEELIKTIGYGSEVTSDPLLKIVADLVYNDNAINAEREGFNYLLSDGVFESDDKFKIETSSLNIKIYSGKLKVSDQYTESIVEFLPTLGYTEITLPNVIKKNWYRRDLIRIVFKRETSEQLPLIERISEPENKNIIPRHTKHDKVFTNTERSYPLYSILLKNDNGVTTIQSITKIFDYVGLRSFVLFEDADLFSEVMNPGLYDIRKFTNPSLYDTNDNMLSFEYALNSFSLATYNMYNFDGPNYITPGTLASIYTTVRPETQIAQLNDFSRYNYPVYYEELLKNKLAEKDIELRELTIGLDNYSEGSNYEGLEAHIYTASPYAQIANNSYITQLNINSIATLSTQISATLEPNQIGLIVDLNLRNFVNTIDINDNIQIGTTLPIAGQDFILLTDGIGKGQIAQIAGLATSVGSTYLNTIVVYSPSIIPSTNSELIMFKNSTATLVGASLSTYINSGTLSTVEINDYKNQYPFWDDTYYKDHQHTGILMIPYSNAGYDTYETISQQLSNPATERILNTYYKIKIPCKVRLKYNRWHFIRFRLLRKAGGSYGTNRPNVVVQNFSYDGLTTYNGYFETKVRNNKGNFPGILNGIKFFDIKDYYGSLSEYHNERGLSHNKPKYYIFQPKDLSNGLTYPPRIYPVDNPEKPGIVYVDLINGKILFAPEEAPVTENMPLQITYLIENIINGYVNTESIIHYLDYNESTQKTITLANVLEAYDKNRLQPWNEYPLREYELLVTPDAEYQGDGSFTVQLPDGFTIVSKSNILCIINAAILHPDDYYLGEPSNLLDRTKITFKPNIISEGDEIYIKHMYGIKGERGDAGIGAEWETATEYFYNNIVTQEHKLYRSLINNNIYNTPGRDLTIDPPAFPNWSSIAIYNLNDGVLFDNIAYLSLSSNNYNNIPTIATTYWANYIDTVYPLWSSIATYNLNNLSRYGGLVYKSLTNDNINNEPNIATTNWIVYNIWEEINFNYVHAENDQTINGIKSFDYLPEVPISTPTKDTQVISKKYLDDVLSDQIIDIHPTVFKFTKHNRNILGKQVTATWNPKISPSNNNFSSIVWADKLKMLIAVATSGTSNRSMISYDGILWHDALNNPSLATWSLSDYEWNGIAQSSDLDVVLVGSNGRLAASEDGFTWDNQSTDVHNGNKWESVCWSETLQRFVAVASTTATNNFNVVTGTKIWSTDGTIATIFWNVQTQATYNLNTWYSVCRSEELGLFVAVATNGTERIMYSETGLGLWTLVVAPQQNQWNSVCWSPELGMFAAVAYNSNATNNLMISYDGINWELGNIPCPSNSTQWTSITWAPEIGMFCAVADLGTKRVATSKDGINWALHYSSTQNAWKSITWSPDLGIFVAVSNTGNFNRIMTSIFPWDLV